MNASDLVGTWRLAAFVLVSESGEVTYPFGSGATGFLIYTHDGYVSVTMVHERVRPPFREADVLRGSLEEKAQAMETYVSYSGRYVLEGDRVFHHIESSLFPNWSGRTQERRVTLQGDSLILLSPPLWVAGRTQTGQMTWTRAARA